MFTSIIIPIFLLGLMEFLAAAIAYKKWPSIQDELKIRMWTGGLIAGAALCMFIGYLLA